ncbi:hypothetical protein, partial [Legionella pneumophila]|uniref:hypothetical protein n=1 Tax=Legionella pneumophila TaxID=446 RepID=UPI0019D5106F
VSINLPIKMAQVNPIIIIFIHSNHFSLKLVVVVGLKIFFYFQCVSVRVNGVLAYIFLFG